MSARRRTSGNQGQWSLTDRNEVREGRNCPSNWAATGSVSKRNRPRRPTTATRSHHDNVRQNEIRLQSILNRMEMKQHIKIYVMLLKRKALGREKEIIRFRTETDKYKTEKWRKAVKPKASSLKRSTNESASGQNDQGTKKTCLVLDAPLPRLEAREGAHACHACAAGRLGERTQGLQAGRGAPTPGRAATPCGRHARRLREGSTPPTSRPHAPAPPAARGRRGQLSAGNVALAILAQKRPSS